MGHRNSQDKEQELAVVIRLTNEVIFWLILRVVSYKYIDVSGVLAAWTARAMIRQIAVRPVFQFSLAAYSPTWWRKREAYLKRESAYTRLHQRNNT